MTTLEAALRDVTTRLADAGARFALVGGLAVSARTEPRFTRDADLAVAVASDTEAEGLVHRLQGAGFTVDTVLEQHQARRLATVRLLAPSIPSGPVIDLLFASSGIEPEVAAAADLLELLPRLHLPVATSGHLIALKVLSRDDLHRPQDLVDLRALAQRSTAAERESALLAVRLIRERGFHRGRDLEAALEELFQPL